MITSHYSLVLFLLSHFHLRSVPAFQLALPGSIHLNTLSQNTNRQHPKNNIQSFIHGFQQKNPSSSSVLLRLSSGGNDGEDMTKSFTTVAGLVVVVTLFVGGSILPLLSDIAGGGVAPLANAVATRDQQQASQQRLVTNDKYRLSRAAIQEKLNSVPVFFIVDTETQEMQTNLFMSYREAQEAAIKPTMSVRATTLDQVEYPLVLQRGRMRMAPPPPEIQKAESALDTSNKLYTLVPSKQAKIDATDRSLTLEPSDIPLFVADRLAFASPNGGLQVPLFLEKQDCVTSYSRLRGTNLNLPEVPIIRITTLKDQLLSMEQGTRPGLTQLSFYASADDVNKAVEILGSE